MQRHQYRLTVATLNAFVALAVYVIYGETQKDKAPIPVPLACGSGQSLWCTSVQLWDEFSTMEF
jgi:hypothetical protein